MNQKLFFLVCSLLFLEKCVHGKDPFFLYYKQNGILCKNALTINNEFLPAGCFNQEKAKQKCTIARPDQAEVIDLVTKEGYSFSALYFDRGKDTVLVLGQGFPGAKENMLFEAGLFIDYDVVVFDYRWQKLATFLLNPMHWSVQELLVNEAEEVGLILKFLQQKKPYKNIIGLAQCYSCFPFLVFQSEQEKAYKKGFTKLILDSCWSSLFEFARRVQHDPLLSLFPHKGGTPHFLKNILNLPGVSHTISALLFLLLPDISIDNYLQAVKCPLLFVHGSKDLLVPYPEKFLSFFSKVSHDDMIGLITPSHHVSSSVDMKEVYNYVVDFFIKNNKCVARKLLAMQHKTVQAASK